MRPVSPFLFRIPARRAVRGNRRGFTMVELLVVIGILLLVAAVTVSAVNMTLSGDRIRGAARQVQSYLEGARGRASYGGTTKGKGYQCGVRFIPEPINPTIISSMVFVERVENYTDGLVNIEEDTTSPLSPLPINMIRHNAGPNSNWFLLARQGLLANG